MLIVVDDDCLLFRDLRRTWFYHFVGNQVYFVARIPLLQRVEIEVGSC